MTAQACRAALEAAFAADPAVRAALGDPPRLVEAPGRDLPHPFAFWRRWETAPSGSSGADTESHTATLEIVTRQTGVEMARAAVGALVAAAGSMRPVSPEVRIILVLPVLADVMRGLDGRTWTGTVRLRIVAEPLV